MRSHPRLIAPICLGLVALALGACVEGGHGYSWRTYGHGGVYGNRYNYESFGHGSGTYAHVTGTDPIVGAIFFLLGGAGVGIDAIFGCD